MKNNVAVLMCVYEKDNLIFFKESVQSIINQTFDDLILFIYVDGPIFGIKKDYLECLDAESSKIKVVFGIKRLGLAHGLNCLLDLVCVESDFDYIARMDADDICRLDRIAIQVDFLQKNKHISVVGSDVVEIDESGNTLFYKKMEAKHLELSSNIIKRCPFNHPSVMFRQNVFFNDSARYISSLQNTQDYYLWVDLLKTGHLFANINEPLLEFRIDKNFHSRRGLKKALNDFKSRVYAFQELKCYSFSNFIHTVLLVILRISPSVIKKIAYNKFR
jgi:hypothetical protein